jgi:hypothetical protein
MRKKIFFGIGIILCCLIAWKVYTTFKPHRNVSGDKAEATLSAAGLYHEFQQDESLANKKWVGKVIEVSGIISSVNESDHYISLNLKGNTDGGINCSVSKKDLEAGDQFRSGDSVTVKGKCTGFLIDVDLVDCVIKKSLPGNSGK